MKLAFGNSWNAEVASNLVQEFAKGNFSELPAIEILPSVVINGANGAFASVTNTIYLSKEFIAQNSTNPEAITSVLLEETGHYIDSRINISDAAGDEGDIFARLVQGKTISVDELLGLKAEDDSALITIGGKATAIEMSQIAMASLGGKLYESHRGFDNRIYTRSSTDGVHWTGWNSNGGGETPSAVSLEALNGRLYQSHRGFDNRIYTRSSTDGVHWTGWNSNGGGETPSTPTLAALNGRLYQSHRGFDNQIYTRSSTDGVSWTGWGSNRDGVTPSAPALAVLNGRLYQSHRGFDNKVYTRSSTNGVNWTGWAESSGWQTTSAPTLEAFNGRLYQSIRGLNNQIYTRSSTNGVNWTEWNNNGGGVTPTAPSLAALNGKLYQSHQGLDNRIYTRSSTNGVNWTGWNNNGGGITPTELTDLASTGTWVNNSYYPINLWRYDANGRTESGGIDTSKDTVVVIHGRGSSDEAGNISNLAKTAAASQYYPNSQVISLDWRKAAEDGVIVPRDAAARISPVAQWAVDRLKELGIDPKRTIVVGHSLGSYVASEMGRMLGGVKQLVALDPAWAPGLPYDLDGNKPGRQEAIDFRNAATNSIAFVASDKEGGWAGDNNRASTAHSSYIVSFTGYRGNNRDTDYHNAIADVYSNLISRRLAFPSLQSNWFDNEGYQLKEEYRGTVARHEGIIAANMTNATRITGLEYVDSSGTRRTDPIWAGQIVL